MNAVVPPFFGSSTIEAPAGQVAPDIAPTRLKYPVPPRFGLVANPGQPTGTPAPESTEGGVNQDQFTAARDAALTGICVWKSERSCGDEDDAEFSKDFNLVVQAFDELARLGGFVMEDEG